MRRASGPLLQINGKLLDGGEGVIHFCAPTASEHNTAVRAAALKTVNTAVLLWGDTKKSLALV